MKFGRVAAAIGAAAILVAGTTAAVHAAGDTSTTLCVPNRLGVVVVADKCPLGTVTVDVATSADVDALRATVQGQATTIAALQTANATQDSAIASMQKDVATLKQQVRQLDPGTLTITGSQQLPGQFTGIVIGSHLEPGSVVKLTHEGETTLIAAVRDDGSVNTRVPAVCHWLPVHVAATTALGYDVSADLTAVAGC
jgi:hypothetical protein